MCRSSRSNSLKRSNRFGTDVMAKILEYDGVIIGAGHNGMICAGYLAKCGQKIMVVEKNMEVGGGLDSQEDRNYPGFRHNIHSVFHRGLMMLPWYKDLDLENFGIHYYRPDPGVVHHFLDKTYLGWFSDVKKTVETIERFSKNDAVSFMDIWTRWQPVVQKIVFTETYAVPLPFDEKKPLLEKTPEGREYLKYFDTTPEEFVLQHFEHPRGRAFIGFLGVMRGYELDAPKTRYLISAMIAWGVNPQLCRGTSHALGDNLPHMMSHNHVDYIEANGVERILVENGHATAVVLEDGTVIKARKFIASNVNPVETFIKLVGRENLDAKFANLAEGFRFSKTTPIFAPNLDEKNILSSDSTTPLDIERHDKNMYCGDWMVGEYSGDQALENRPFPGWGQYKTPIDGLFMCGSSCHPGGNITGAPGYNAAKVIAESLGLKTWWHPVDFREHLRGLV